MPGIDPRNLRKLDPKTRRMIARAFAVARDQQAEIAPRRRERAGPGRRRFSRALVLVSCLVAVLLVAAVMPHL